ncbi:MAG: HD-GYP domain-containing protein [Bacillota bacterium]|nr:HD-GYP domain-containing protein [Bacillota bacterium]
MGSDLKRDLVIAMTVLATAGAMVLSYRSDAPVQWVAVVGFLILASIAQFLSVRISDNVTATFTFPILYAGSIVIGPFWAGVISLLMPMHLSPAAKKWTWRMYVFNHAQMAIATIIGGFTYGALRERAYSLSVQDIGAMIIGSLAAWLVNTTLVALVVSAASGRRVRDSFDYHMAGLTSDYAAMTALAVLMAALYFETGMLGIALLLIPLLVARHAVVMYTDMKKAYAETIASLSVALEVRDAYTAGHSRRVAEIAVRVGEELGLAQSDLETLRYAGLLHDIGKIGIEDRLLKKPARFTPGEYEEIQAHAGLTGSILEGVKGFEKVNDWAKHHHERYDGSGYPDGLRGKQIPLGARILAVADAFDAMASRRVYKPSIPFAEILHELMTHRNTQFDPVVLDAFLRVMEKPGFKEWVEAELPYFAMPGPEEVMAMVESASRETGGSGPGGTDGIENGSPGDQPI